MYEEYDAYDLEETKRRLDEQRDEELQQQCTVESLIDQMQR